MIHQLPDAGSAQGVVSFLYKILNHGGGARIPEHSRVYGEVIAVGIPPVLSCEKPVVAAGVLVLFFNLFKGLLGA